MFIKVGAVMQGTTRVLNINELESYAQPNFLFDFVFTK